MSRLGCFAGSRARSSATFSTPSLRPFAGPLLFALLGTHSSAHTYAGMSDGILRFHNGYMWYVTCRRRRACILVAGGLPRKIAKLPRSNYLDALGHIAFSRSVNVCESVCQSLAAFLRPRMHPRTFSGPFP